MGKKGTARLGGRAVRWDSWQRPTLPQGNPCSTIGPGGLHDRVRDGIGCNSSGKTTKKVGAEARAGDVLLGKRVVRMRRTLDFGKEEGGQAARPISTGQLRTLLCVHTRPITSWSTRGLKEPKLGET